MERLTIRDDRGEAYPLGDALSYQMIDKLCEYEDAEAQGLLLRLPCKVGDTVYAVICGKWVAEGKLERYSYLGEGLSCIVKYEHFGTCQMFGWFNKTVFLTREDAEAALAKGD